jgi:hypothetical protein
MNNNTATTGNPIAEDGFGPADTMRTVGVTIADLNVGDTVKVPGARRYNVRTIAAFENIDGHGRCLILDDGMIITSGGLTYKVAHFLGNGHTA